MLSVVGMVDVDDELLIQFLKRGLCNLRLYSRIPTHIRVHSKGFPKRTNFLMESSASNPLYKPVPWVCVEHPGPHAPDLSH